MTVIYLLFAGTVTVSATVRYTLLLLLKYPEVQERVREELTKELGAGRAPGLGDRARLPYTDAVLHEAQRLLALVPMGIPHVLTRPTYFRGYTLPQVSLRASHAQWYLCLGLKSVAICLSDFFWILVSFSLCISLTF